MRCKIVAYALLVPITIAFGYAVFFVNSYRFEDPKDSPLYESTLRRSLQNFQRSDFVVGERPPQTFAIQQQPDAAAQAHFRQGIEFYQQEKYHEAIAQFEAADRLSPVNQNTLAYLSAAYAKSGDMEKARTISQRLQQLRSKQQPHQQPHQHQPAQQQTQPAPQESEAAQFLREGSELFHQGKFKQALQVLLQSFQLDQRNVETLRLIGQCHLMLDETDKTVQAYEVAARIAPENNVIFQELGEIYRHLGQPDKAKQAYEKALALNPEDNQSHAGLAMLLREEGEDEAANERFQREIDRCRTLIAREPQNPAHYATLASFYLHREVQLQEGLAMAQKAIQLAPGDSRYIAIAAELHAKLGNIQKAIELIDTAIAGEEGHGGYYMLLKQGFLKKQENQDE